MPFRRAVPRKCVHAAIASLSLQCNVLQSISLNSVLNSKFKGNRKSFLNRRVFWADINRYAGNYYLSGSERREWNCWIFGIFVKYQQQHKLKFENIRLIFGWVQNIWNIDVRSLRFMVLLKTWHNLTQILH